METFKKLLSFFRDPIIVHAHCDIPCGIYDPHAAQIAALTVVRMNQLISELPKPGPSANAQELESYSHKIARFAKVKEEHAEICKHELRVIWGDYFTADHIKQFPQLHGLFWDAMKLGSKVRQEINMQAALDLLAKVQEIAQIFWKTKGAESKTQPSLQKSGQQILYPVPAS